MQIRKLIPFVILGLTFTIISCSKEEEAATNSPTVTIPAGPQDTVTSFMVYFTNSSDSVTEVGSYDDPDGPGPKQASIGGVSLKANATYKVTFFIEDATNPSKIVYLHNKIKSNGKEYKLCISNPLGVSVNALDSDGSLPIGLVNDLITTGNTGSDNMNFTIKYQKDVKNGQCSPGIVYYSCNLPIGIY